MEFDSKNNFRGFLITWVGDTIKVLGNIQVSTEKIVSRRGKRQGSTIQDNFNIWIKLHPAKKTLFNST